MAIEDIISPNPLIEQLIKRGLNYAKVPYTRYKLNKLISNRHRRALEICSVKTFLNTDKDCNISKFYCSPHIIDTNGIRKRVEDSSSIIDGSNFVLIEGTAGQGKSILLRHLHMVEHSKGKVIPLFIELKKIGNTYKSIKSLIRLELSFLKINIDDNLLLDFLSSTHFLLLIDGFDEVSEKFSSDIINEIDSLISSLPSLKIIITSRPGLNICSLNSINVVKLDYLIKDEYKDIINKFKQGDDVTAIINSTQNISGILITPLLVTLAIVYHHQGVPIPDSHIEFYENLFEVLLVRHDYLKSGFNRSRQCNTLHNNDYRKIFNAFCFYSLKNNNNYFTQDQIIDFCLKSINASGESINPNMFIDDIIKITCLLLKDGTNYNFIHKTIQEYYAASYIKSLPEKKAQIFYNSIIDNQENKIINNSFIQEITTNKYMNVLNFLFKIDNFRMKKHYILYPHLKYCSDEFYNNNVIYIKNIFLFYLNKIIYINNIISMEFESYNCFSNCIIKFILDNTNRLILSVSFRYLPFNIPLDILIISKIIKMFNQYRKNINNYEYKDFFNSYLSLIQQLDLSNIEQEAEDKAIQDWAIISDIYLPPILNSIFDDIKKKANELEQEIERQEDGSELFTFIEDSFNK